MVHRLRTRSRDRPASARRVGQRVGVDREVRRDRDVCRDIDIRSRIGR